MSRKTGFEMMDEMTTDDVRELMRVNWLAKADRKKKEFCYRIKDILLKKYSVFDGYDLQEFTRPCWIDEEVGPWDDLYYAGETYSWHEHILERRLILDAVFHRPTEHFRYSDIKDHAKQSAGFEEMLALCREQKIEGTQEPPEDFQNAAGIRALRRLVHKFKNVLRQEIPKPPRPKYPFLKVRRYSYSGEFNNFHIRVPSSVAVCSGCGAKLVTEISNWHLLKIKLGIFQEVRRVFCDSHFNYGQGGWLKPECRESLSQTRYEWRSYGREPGYQTEKRIVSEWTLEFFTEHLEEFTEELGLAEWFEKNAHEFAEVKVEVI